MEETAARAPFMGYSSTHLINERRTMLASGAGWALDAFDVQVYSYVIPTLMAAWSICRAEASILGTSTLLISALGRWIIGVLCDRLGQVRMLQITILWFAFSTFHSVQSESRD